MMLHDRVITLLLDDYIKKHWIFSITELHTKFFQFSFRILSIVVIFNIPLLARALSFISMSWTITDYRSSLSEISFTSNRNFDEFLMTPLGKRSLISPPSSSWYQQSLSAFSALTFTSDLLLCVVMAGSALTDVDDDVDAGDDSGEVFAIFGHPSSLSMSSADFIFFFFFIFIGAQPRFCRSLKGNWSLHIARIQDDKFQKQLSLTVWVFCLEIVALAMQQSCRAPMDDSQSLHLSARPHICRAGSVERSIPSRSLPCPCGIG